MRPAARLVVCAGLASAAAALVACAGLVGADFGDAHLSQVQGHDSGLGTTKDAGTIIAAEGGACPTGLTNCDGFCVDVNTDPTHCKTCSNVCPSDQHGPAVCVAGTCELACQSGWFRCGDACCSNTTGADSSTDTGAPDTGTPDTGADTGPVDPGIACGSSECAAGSSFCCGGPITGNPTDRCSSSPNDQCSWDIRCDDAADCTGGRVCCADDSLGESFCASACTTSQIQLCDPNVLTECLGGTSCTGTFSRSQLSDTYAACQ